jgi:hypothetical protein
VSGSSAIHRNAASRTRGVNPTTTLDPNRWPRGCGPRAPARASVLALR